MVWHILAGRIDHFCCKCCGIILVAVFTIYNICCNNISPVRAVVGSIAKRRTAGITAGHLHLGLVMAGYTAVVGIGIILCLEVCTVSIMFADDGCTVQAATCVAFGTTFGIGCFIIGRMPSAG